MKVYLIAHTAMVYQHAYEASGGRWLPDEGLDPYANQAGDLSEFAGRACYQSWGKPNAATATNAGYIGHIKDVGHWSVIEHGSVTICISQVSRSFTHELIRHRHFSYSQLSQRYCTPTKVKDDINSEPLFIVPPLFEGDAEAYEIMWTAWKAAVDAYDALAERALALIYGSEGQSSTGATKRAREAARAVLPNMTPTEIVVTGNHRSWLHFLELRGSIHADAEIRAVALAIFSLLADLEPNIYDHLGVGVEVLRRSPEGKPIELARVIMPRHLIKAAEDLT